MAKSMNFKISSEGDCERVSKVFIEWLKTKSPELKKPQHILAPAVPWANLFAEIYSDDIANHNLVEEAENNVIQINFHIDTPVPTDLSKLSTEELVEMLEAFLEEVDEEGFIEIEGDLEEEDDDTETE